MLGMREGIKKSFCVWLGEGVVGCVFVGVL